ncbi:hypothetical protein OCU04_004440 [Sclerotinia nivalis]|uniref:Ankyrin repeat protein n=1 Tax=Sclerotinia nivalis TaxID=352851 RepID=A0A9X0AQT3_9HELO|nr:hypothetical protein OCU04_004440 [Sclerotinia nivalis]
MADPRDVEYEEEETPVHKQIRAAIFMNSIGTLNVAIERFSSKEEAAEYLNTEALDTQGNVAYHLAAREGKSDIIDELLDIEGFECDPLNHNGETPLHSAILWVNEGRENWSDGLALVEMMLEAGSDNRIRNKQGKTAADFVEQHFELKQLLKEHTFQEDDENGNPAPESEKVESGYLDIDEAEDGKDDENSVYSGSDSEEEEEWKRRHEEKAKKAAS